MEYGNIEREIHIEASPEMVFEVITSPEHLKEWWPDEAVSSRPRRRRASSSSATGRGRGPRPRDHRRRRRPPRLFSFRWVYPDGEDAPRGNSLLVTFELSPAATAPCCA